MSAQDLDALQPDLSLALSAQYLRAWRKFVERIPRYSRETIAVDALPFTSFQLSALTSGYLKQVPDTKLASTVREVKFADILSEFLFPRHEQFAVDKQQRAKRINELYAQRPTFDETEFTVGDLKAFFGHIIPEVPADRFDFLYAGQNIWIPDHFTILSVWTHAKRYSANATEWCVILGFEYVPLRMAIDTDHDEFVKSWAQYNLSTTDSSNTDKSLVPAVSSRQLCDGPELSSSQIFLSPQHVVAWHKYVARDPRFAKDPISYKNFVERATLAFIDSTGAPYQCSAQSPLRQFCGKIKYTKLIEMFLLPDSATSREQRSDAINELYATRPDFDETQLSVDDLVTVLMRAVPGKWVHVLHPGHHPPFPGPIPLSIVQRGLMKENQTRGFLGRFESVALALRIGTAQSQAGDERFMAATQVFSDNSTEHERMRESVEQAKASGRGSASAAGKIQHAKYSPSPRDGRDLNAKMREEDTIVEDLINLNSFSLLSHTQDKPISFQFASHSQESSEEFFAHGAKFLTVLCHQLTAWLVECAWAGKMPLRWNRNQFCYC